ncbi:MAG TPA: hypothetical protein VF158_14060 [Longimicrobiales bacterium]
MTITGSAVECIDIALENGFWLYRYRVSNPSTSDVGIVAFKLDVRAPLGIHPAMLPTNGIFLADATRTAVDASAGHVPVGFDVPEGWRAMIHADGWGEWWGPGEGLHAIDAIAPGEFRQDFAVRSTHLPGIRAVTLLPDYPYACCSYPVGDPRNAGVEVKRAEDFQVSGSTVGPVFPPQSMNPELLSTLVERACTDLGWITNPGVCRSLEAKLEAAARALERGQMEAARGQLGSFLQELEAQHGPEPGKHVSDNAYWLLKINAEYVRGTL